MKNIVKWVFIVVAVIVFAIDIAGFWKYKLNGTKYVISTGSSDDVGSPEIVEPEILYTNLTSSDLENGEKLFITDIDAEEDGTYTIKGLIYDEVEITKDEYNTLKNGKDSVTILEKEYEKDKIKSSNIILKEVTDVESDEEDDESNEIYVKYDSTSKKYLVRDSSTDYIVYNPTEKYVKYNVKGTLPVTIVKNSKSTKKTIEDIESEYKEIELPSDTVKIDLASFTFDKKGVCTSIKIDKK